MNLRAAAAIAVFVVASLSGATAFAQTAGQPRHDAADAGDRRLVDRLVTRWERSWNTYDLREVDSVFWSDRSVTYFSSERAGLIRGIDALREHHAGFGFVAGGKVLAIEGAAKGPAIVALAILIAVTTLIVTQFAFRDRAWSTRTARSSSTPSAPIL